MEPWYLFDLNHLDGEYSAVELLRNGPNRQAAVNEATIFPSLSKFEAWWKNVRLTPCGGYPDDEFPS